MDKYYVYRPMINLIGKSEGTAPPKGRGYNETLSYGAFTGGNVELTSMTLDQIDKLQTRMLRHPKNKLRSSAVGWLQIVRTTLREVRKTLGLTGDELFNADMQDRLTCYLLGVRGIDKWLAGRLKTTTLINNLAKEWASLPKTDGKGAYDGQHARVSVAEVEAALAAVKARHAKEQPGPKETVPETVEEKVKEKTTFWQWLMGLFSSGALGLGWLNGLDPWAILAFGGVVIAAMIVVFILRRQLIGAVKQVRAELAE